MSASPLVDPSALDLTRRQRRERTARALAAAAVTRSSSRREQLEDYVIRLNMDVARSVASRYFERGIEQEDLLQVAYAALTRATRDFDPDQHRDFLSYAVPTIRGEVKKHFRDRDWTVRPPGGSRSCPAASRESKATWRNGSAGHLGPSEVAEEPDADFDHVVEAPPPSSGSATCGSSRTAPDTGDR
jgi:RNA polymerase sigma-B factor